MTGAERNPLMGWDAHPGSTEVWNLTPQSSQYGKNFALARVSIWFLRFAWVQVA